MKCIFCHKINLPPQFKICTSCALKYGVAEQQATCVRIKPRSEWPAWIHQAIKDYDREYAFERVWNTRIEPLTRDGMPFSQFTEGENKAEGNSGTNEDMKSYREPWRPSSTIDVLIAEGWVQRSPYPTEELNRQYRKANGIPK